MTALSICTLTQEDGPQGVADELKNVTGWPSQLTVAMAWEPDLMEEWGAAMGAEQKLKGTRTLTIHTAKALDVDRSRLLMPQAGADSQART